MHLFPSFQGTREGAERDTAERGGRSPGARIGAWTLRHPQNPEETRLASARPPAHQATATETQKQATDVAGGAPPGSPRGSPGTWLCPTGQRPTNPRTHIEGLMLTPMLEGGCCDAGDMPTPGPRCQGPHSPPQLSGAALAPLSPKV